MEKKTSTVILRIEDELKEKLILYSPNMSLSKFIRTILKDHIEILESKKGK
jgi:predicted DNA-binding protein